MLIKKSRFIGCVQPVADRLAGLADQLAVADERTGDQHGLGRHSVLQHVCKPGRSELLEFMGRRAVSRANGRPAPRPWSGGRIFFEQDNFPGQLLSLDQHRLAGQPANPLLPYLGANSKVLIFARQHRLDWEKGIVNGSLGEFQSFDFLFFGINFLKKSCLI